MSSVHAYQIQLSLLLTVCTGCPISSETNSNANISGSIIDRSTQITSLMYHTIYNNMLKCRSNRMPPSDLRVSYMSRKRQIVLSNQRATYHISATFPHFYFYCSQCEQRSYLHIFVSSVVLSSIRTIAELANTVSRQRDSFAVCGHRVSATAW